MRICVVGIGKIGLPIALQAASTGHQVIGADINLDLVNTVMSGNEPFPGEAHLLKHLSDALEAGLFTATTVTADAVSQSEAVIVAVPLVVDADLQPDFRALDAATAAIGSGLQPGTLVSYETTVPVGTTRGRFVPDLAARSGLVAGQDFFVCFSPERVFSGRIFADLRKWPKIVGGIDQESTDLATRLYESILKFDDRDDLDRPNGVWRVESAETAEMVKLAETTYRDINIALANEFSCYADRMGIRFESVIQAANSQPFSHIHRPGVAVGGHCIPVYPHLYAHGDSEARMPLLSRSINDAMPAYAVRRLQELVGDLGGRTVAVLGAAYRGGVKETAFSGVFPVVEELTQRGANPKVHDPLYSDEELRVLGFEPFQLGMACEGMLLQADHSDYQDLTIGDLPGVQGVVDGRGILDPAYWFDNSVAFAALGRGDLT
jgi:nucleotide sugar dehydrogenase|tara:strand:+ start:306 stop:1610 length:1305 start_codon:yes stop_codon:yes gene_type:complete